MKSVWLFHFLCIVLVESRIHFYDEQYQPKLAKREAELHLRPRLTHHSHSHIDWSIELGDSLTDHLLSPLLERYIDTHPRLLLLHLERRFQSLMQLDSLQSQLREVCPCLSVFGAVGHLPSTFLLRLWTEPPSTQELPSLHYWQHWLGMDDWSLDRIQSWQQQPWSNCTVTLALLQRIENVLNQDERIVDWQRQTARRRAWQRRRVDLIEDVANDNEIHSKTLNLVENNNSIWNQFPDPLFPQQWHLINRKYAHHDIHVTTAWSQGYFGNGTVIALLDDGLAYDHEDLHQVYDAQGSYDFNDHDNDPRPVLWDDYHGTRCAGQIAASVNHACGVGVALGARVSAMRILSNVISSADEATALTFQYQHNHLFSCSWGPSDDGMTVEGPDRLNFNAFLQGILHGRQGKGTVYVMATGNGKQYDNCNYDGYTNLPFTLSVGAIDYLNRRPYYTEPCSAQLFVTYSSTYELKITTTDYKKESNVSCTDQHGGTSAAAPLAAGILALALSVRPDLTWRDLQALSIAASHPIDIQDVDWNYAPGMRYFNHKYGFGLLDASELVLLAKNWTLLSSPTVTQFTKRQIQLPIPQNEQGVNDSILVEVNQISPLRRLEQITICLTLEHEQRGDLEVYLDSPSHTTSILLTQRPLDRSQQGLKDWMISTTRHWGEPFLGQWTLRIIDRVHPEKKGQWISWQLFMWGESDVENKDNYDYEKRVLQVYFPDRNRPISNNNSNNSNNNSSNNRNDTSNRSNSTNTLLPSLELLLQDPLLSPLSIWHSLFYFVGWFTIISWFVIVLYRLLRYCCFYRKNYRNISNSSNQTYLELQSL